MGLRWEFRGTIRPVKHLIKIYRKSGRRSGFNSGSMTKRNVNGTVDSVTRRLRSGGRSARRSVSRISSAQPIGPTTKDHREMTAGPTTGVMHLGVVMHLGAVKSRAAINQ